MAITDDTPNGASIDSGRALVDDPTTAPVPFDDEVLQRYVRGRALASVAGNLMQTRLYHTATRLLDGRVLVACGAASGLIVVFRANLWNLGSNGQYLLAAAMVAGTAPGLLAILPPPVGWIALMALAMVVGGLWTFVPAILKARFGMNEIITSPLSTATPDKAMKPTAAEMDNGMPRAHSASTPPVSAKGMPVNTSSPSFRLPNIANNSTNTRNSAPGTTPITAE